MKNNPPEMIKAEKRRQLIQIMIDYFATERDERIGIVAAESLLDAILPDLFPAIYNQALKDVKKVLEEHVAMAEVDLELLTKDE